MSLPVVTVAAGGLPVIQLAGVGGLPVIEAANRSGLAVTKVTARGLPATFVDASGAVVPPVVSYTSWNPADLSSINLTNNNLTATGTIASGGGVRAIKSISSGKYYWESKISFIQTNGMGMGVGTGGASLTAGSSIAGVGVITRLGTVWINAVNTGVSLGTRAVNDIIGIAIDKTANLIWFRLAPAGIWNNSGTADPATGIGGISISALAGVLYPLFVTGSGGIGDAIIANFGASAFNGAVPVGFTSGITS